MTKIAKDKWNRESEILIREAERLMTETEIGLFIHDQMQVNKSTQSGDSYSWGFQEALETVLTYLNARAISRRSHSLISAENEPKLAS